MVEIEGGGRRRSPLGGVGWWVKQREREVGVEGELRRWNIGIHWTPTSSAAAASRVRSRSMIGKKKKPRRESCSRGRSLD